MKTTNELFGLRIKELRENKKLTQENLAELINIDSRTLSRIETGKNFTTLETLEKMAKILDVEIKDFFIFEHHKNAQDLISSINKMVSETEFEKLKLIYKMVDTMVK
jgi:transcriptional regulator with XRE-family HTH domain